MGKKYTIVKQLKQLNVVEVKMNQKKKRNKKKQKRINITEKMPFSQLIIQYRFIPSSHEMVPCER